MQNNLKEVRRESKMVIWQLAAETGVSPATISAIERYNFAPRDKTKQKLAQGLNVPVSRIWPGAPTASN